jgi:hypothetical protein
VDLIEVDVVGLQPSQARLARFDDVLAARAQIVHARTCRAEALGGDQHVLTAILRYLTKDLLGLASAVDIGGVEQVHARIETHIDLTGSFRTMSGSDGAKRA